MWKGIKSETCDGFSFETCEQNLNQGTEKTGYSESLFQSLTNNAGNSSVKSDGCPNEKCCKVSGS